MKYEIDIVLSVIPAVIAIVAVFMLTARYYKFRQRHHLFLLIIFILLAFTFTFSFVYNTGSFSTVALLFPLRQPVNLLLVPFSSFYGYILFLGVRIPLRKMIIHVLPALFVFISFIPFWFLQPELQNSYLSLGLDNYLDNKILHNTELLRKVSIIFIFNFQFIVYNTYIIIKFRKFDMQSNITLQSHPGAGLMSVILLFVSSLYVMINNALNLGVPVNMNSRIFFNSAAIVVLLAFFISGYKRKTCFAREKVPELDYTDDTDNE